MTAAITARLEPFGTPRMRIDGVPMRPGSRKALGLAILLALEGPQTRERLCAMLWPDADSAAARRNLRRDVFRLRGSGLPLAENADGALALACVVECDRDGAAGAALQGLEGLAGIEFEDWLAQTRADLEMARSQRLHSDAASCRDRGDDDGAMALWRRALALDSCDESAAQACIDVLMAQGQRAAAVSLYERTRHALAAQLGLAPSAALRAQGETLRVAAPAASTGAAAPQALPRVPPPGPVPALVTFIDRPALCERIASAWRARRRVYLAGPAGIGKSRLARECASAHGAWLQVACTPNDALLPNAWPVRALRLLREASPDVALAPWMRRELAALLPELGRAPRALATDEARARLVAALAAAFGALVHGNFQVLVLDDWQWTDSASLELWDALRDAAPGLCWLVTFRSGQLPRAALERMRSEIDAGRAERIDLPGLDDAEALQLVRALSGPARAEQLAARLRAATDGNPFYLLETLRHLEADGWRTARAAASADDHAMPVVPTVREALQARARALGEPVHRLLEAASLLADRFDATVLADASGLAEDGILAALAHAAAAQLVVEERDGFRFTHDLVRQCLADGLGATRRRALHRRLADGLQRQGAAPALIAAQLEAAGLPLAALPWRCEAARGAMQLHALGQALAHWQHALDDGAAGAQAAEIHLHCAELLRRRGDRGAAEAALQRATAAAGSDRDLALTAQVARAELWVADRGDLAVQWLDALAADLAQAPAPLQSRALAARALALNAQDRVADAAALLQEAVARLHDQPDSRVMRGKLLDTLARNALRRGQLAAALQYSRQAVSMLDTVAASVEQASALVLQGSLLLNLSQRAEAEAVLEQARALAAGIGHVSVQRAALLNLVKLATDVGDTAHAVALLDEGEALAPNFEHARAHAGFSEARFYVDYLRGDAAAARAAALRLLRVVDTLPGRTERIGSRTMVVDFFLLEGDLARAAELLVQAEQLCDEQRAAGEAGLFHAACSTRRAWWLIESGQPDAALALLDAMVPPEREQDRVDRAWIAASAALALQDPARARAWLDTAPPGDDVPADLVAMWCAQALRLAAAEGGSDAPTRARAQALLQGRRAPAAVAERLRRALG